MAITAKLSMGAGCDIHPDAYVGYREHGGEIILGDSVRIQAGAILRTCTGRIVVGDHTSIGNYVVIHALGGVAIGSHTLVSPCVQIYAQNHGIERSKLIASQPQTGRGIRIGNDCWIGGGAVILDGVTIGDGVVVAAGAVVVSDVSPYVVVGGNPAVVKGERH